MPQFCAVYGCRNRSNREKDKRFFRVPKVVSHKGDGFKKLTEERRQKWIRNLRLRGAVTDNARVCSDHFVTGCPSSATDFNSEDWAPTVNLGYQKGNSRPQTDTSRQQEERAEAQEFNVSSAAEEEAAAASREEDFCEVSLTSEEKYFKDAECQTDLSMVDLTRLMHTVNVYTSEICSLRKKVSDAEFSPEAFQNNEKTKFYTGLPNFLVLMQIFQLCEPYITTSRLSKFEQFLMILMRLRLNLQLQDLAHRFNVSTATVSQIWVKLIHVLHSRLESQIDWPERDVLQSALPVSFRKAFGLQVAVILDCFEVFIEKPKTSLAQAQSWSNYKCHNTIKFLIGITPQGYVTYVSSAWGGKTSDKQITEECGILNKLLPGDIVLADRSFTVKDSAGFYCASLNPSSFTKGKKQLSVFEVEQTRKLTSVRIHVERVIGLVRRKYQILQSRALPVEHMAVKSADSLELVEKIAVICCALSNLSESIVPLD